MDISNLDTTLAKIHTSLSRILMSGRIDGEDLEALEAAEEAVNDLRNTLASENEPEPLTATVQ
jgi:hypothetical protein